MRRALLAASLVLAFACSEPKQEQAATPASTSTMPVEQIPKYTTEPEPDQDSNNLLNLAWGAAVVSRSGEQTLEWSAVHGIDSSVRTIWSSAPGNTDHTIVFSLLAPARITRVGISAPELDTNSPTRMIYETSMDGTTWRRLIVQKTKGAKEPQLVDVTPTVAQYIRVMTSGVADLISVRSFHAVGKETQPPAPWPSMTGCWRINGANAKFAQDGATITGVIATEPPTLLDGGTNGRVASLMWSQNPTWGYTAITQTPDGQHLSGVKIHEEISTQQYGDGWFGERIPCNAIDLTTPQPGTIETRAPRWSLYGVEFDLKFNIVADASRAELDALANRIAAVPSQRFRIVAYEFRDATKEKNQAITKMRLDSLRNALQSRGVDLTRIEFVAAGNDWKEPPIETALQRAMASRIDLERFGR